jgi:recombination endonuclease VII
MAYSSPEAKLANQREYRARNRVSLAAKQRAYHIANREKVIPVTAAAHIKRKYGLSKDQHAAMRADQDNKCAVCRDETKLIVDHCHSTNKVRGLLCSPCNSCEGFARSSPDILRALADYLENRS